MTLALASTSRRHFAAQGAKCMAMVGLIAPYSVSAATQLTPDSATAVSADLWRELVQRMLNHVSATMQAQGLYLPACSSLVYASETSSNQQPAITICEPQSGAQVRAVVCDQCVDQLRVIEQFNDSAAQRAQALARVPAHLLYDLQVSSFKSPQN
jgi:hypothetical protein